MSMLNKIKTRLQTEAETHSETTRQLETLQMQLGELQQMVGNNAGQFLCTLICCMYPLHDVFVCV